MRLTEIHMIILFLNRKQIYTTKHG